MEDYSKPYLGPQTKNYYDHVFGVEMTTELVHIFGKEAKYLIREFLFGLDCLIEVVQDPVTPYGRFLNNEDVDERLVKVTQQRARMENKQEYFGCQVKQETALVLAEFFEQGYLRIFNFVLDKLRPHLNITVDGCEYLLYINKEWSTPTSTSVLHFKVLDTDGKRISIPFKRKRLLV